MNGFTDDGHGRDMFRRGNVVEYASVGVAHLHLVMSQAEEELQASDERREQANVLNVSVDVLQIEIVAEIFREIGQAAEDEIEKQEEFLRENVRVILDPEGEVVDQSERAGVDADDQFRVAKVRPTCVDVRLEEGDERVQTAEQTRVLFRTMITGGGGVQEIRSDVFPTCQRCKGEVLLLTIEQLLHEQDAQAHGKIDNVVVVRCIAKDVVEDALLVQFQRVVQTCQFVVDVVAVGVGGVVGVRVEPIVVPMTGAFVGGIEFRGSIGI